MNVNFSVFIDKILSGEKRQTIRRASDKWANVKAGDRLDLYTGLGTPHKRKLGEAVVESITPIFLTPAVRRAWVRLPGFVGLLSDDALELIALMDGFPSLSRFWQFFGKKCGFKTLEFYVIRWVDFKEVGNGQ